MKTSIAILSALVLSVMGLWEFWGRRGFQREKITKGKVVKD
jgi:hypothetical protein